MTEILTEKNIAQAFSELGIQKGDTVLVHSSLKSLGTLENGPETVIRGIESLIGDEGTLVMPTLISVDFQNAYKTWYMDKPSDVGYLTEYFRKLPYVYRSNQATHSVAARGKKAYELTCEHTAYGPHICPFGDYAMADSSPWMKMYEKNVHIVFIGVSTKYNTMKHVVEIKFAEELLSKVKDANKREHLISQLRTFDKLPDGIWPYYKASLMEEEMERVGLVTHTQCGPSHLRRIRAKESSDFALTQLINEPSKWYKNEVLEWIETASSVI